MCHPKPTPMGSQAEGDTGFSLEELEAASGWVIMSGGWSLAGILITIDTWMMTQMATGHRELSDPNDTSSVLPPPRGPLVSPSPTVCGMVHSTAHDGPGPTPALNSCPKRGAQDSPKRKIQR